MYEKYRLAWQNQNTAIFAEIHVSADKLTTGEYLLEIPAHINKTWALGVRFAFEVFKEGLQGNGLLPEGVRFEVKEIVDQSVDTTIAAVAYVAFHGMCRAAGVALNEMFLFNEGDGTFCINYF